MAFAHVSLEVAELGPIAAKFVGDAAPEKMRMMVAGGLAPLPPRDMLVALYQVWVSNDDHAETAGKTIEGLPAAVLDGALADKRLPAGVLDLLGRKFARNDAVLQQVIRHPKVDDESLIGIARVCPEGVCDVLADNETRWLACPKIVASLYQNRHCRMSVIHRMLELADRQDVDLGLPAMDEIRLALADSGPVDETRDQMFKDIHSTEKVVEAEAQLLDMFGAADVQDQLDLPEFDDPDAEIYEGPLPGDEAGDGAEAGAEQAKPEDREEDKQPISKESRMHQIGQMRPLEKIRTALLGDKYDRSLLVRDSNKTVAMATIRSPKVRDDEAVAFAANRSLPQEVITYISNRREWVKLYTVKLHLVMNPKTPLARSMSLLAFLNRTDVQKVARSKAIPSALATAAKRKIQARR
ncbi:hypothetical protein DB30_06925 [Enhygromyxa salina]|uniref:Uncharacterized protein n=1 Tax=Enhygromyxa salina TaxID=215803 RepID=A0A0C1ZTE9_9BACT|nr:hypothetical protein [Enhygromyxa salina]KIG14323.1 hypothetical protein DB30_06925 [Enhygromyxa salina]